MNLAELAVNTIQWRHSIVARQASRGWISDRLLVVLTHTVAPDLGNRSVVCILPARARRPARGGVGDLRVLNCEQPFTVVKFY